VRPIFEAHFRSTPSIANIVSPVSVSPHGAEQTTVKYPLISLPVGPRDNPRKRPTTPPNSPVLYFFNFHWENIYAIYVIAIPNPSKATFRWVNDIDIIDIIIIYSMDNNNWSHFCMNIGRFLPAVFIFMF
jgi:hypothetical protein